MSTMYTIKQLADIAHITVRTLHHYDHIGLFKPTQIGDNGYRYYDDKALYQLQQILIYRKMGLELAQIRDIIHAPDFNASDALRSQRDRIQAQMAHLNHLMQTIDHTLNHMEGRIPMSKKKMFEPFDDEQQKEYEREVRLRYDPEKVRESQQNWGSYDDEKKQEIMDEGNAIYDKLGELLASGKDATDDAVQATFHDWHQHLRNFYEPSLDLMRGLGQMYVDDYRFADKFRTIHPTLPEYLRDGIEHYVDVLETEAIERLLADDEASDTM